MELEYFVIFKPRPDSSTVEYSFVEKELFDELTRHEEIVKYYEVTHAVHTREEIDGLLEQYKKESAL